MAERGRADALQQRLAAIVESSSDAIVSTATDGTVTSWNRGAERIFGFPREEAIGRPVALVAAQPPVDVVKRKGQAHAQPSQARRQRQGAAGLGQLGAPGVMQGSFQGVHGGAQELRYIS
jgi:PAS domain-containing protein